MISPPDCIINICILAKADIYFNGKSRKNNPASRQAKRIDPDVRKMVKKVFLTKWHAYRFETSYGEIRHVRIKSSSKNS